MHPAFLDNMSWEMAEVYGAITDQILINLARHFPFYEYVDDIPTSAFTYQAQMLAQMGQINKETIQIIRNGLEDADLALKGVLEQAIIDAVKTAEPELLDGVKKGVFQMPTTPIVAPNQMRAYQLYYGQAAEKLNLVNTVMLESTQSAYQQAVSDVVSEIELADKMYRTQLAIDTATGEVVTGVSSWNQAIKHATDRMTEGGIVGFIDHAGRRWSAEAYVAMDMRTTVFNTGRAATWETNQNFGNDLYIVSYHNGARPLCYPWQNKVISSMDAARMTYDLDGNEIQVIAQSDTSYGQPAGLFGINCKHYPTPFIPGVSVIEGQPQDPEANAKTYEESQKQRALERKLREEKRDLQMLKEQGASDEDISKQRAKCRQTSEDIDTFCKETGRARHRDREAVYTKREFPDADRYDVSKFEKDQKKLIDDYYKAGGEQQNYKSGQIESMESVAPITQTTETVMKATEPETVASDLSASEKAAVESYVSGDTMYVNQVLRGRAGELTTEDKELVKDLDNALSKPIGKTQTLYRSVDAEAVFWKMSSIEYDNLRGYAVYNDSTPVVKQNAERIIAKAQGKTIHELGYMSTTTDYEVASEWGGYTGSEKPIVLKLNTPGSTHGLALTEFEVEEETQSEVLLARGQRYQIKRITGEDGNIVVYADVLER